MEINRPRASQPLRKGKKAWRKNVDIDDIQASLEEQREREIHVGKDPEDFIIDDEADKNVEAQVAHKKLKSTEILTNKSKVPALQSVRSNKIQGVSKKSLAKLVQLSGRKDPSQKLKARVDKDGIIRAGKQDPWADAPKEPTPEFLKESWKIHAPKTLKEKPLQLWGEAQEKIPDAGKSYNPSLDSWKSLINKEFDVENEKEIKRIQIEEHQEKINHLILTSTEKEVESSSSEDEQDDEPEHESADYKLSVNQPTERKKKTKAQRNKEARNKQRMQLEAELKTLKHQLHDLDKYDEYKQQEEQKEVKQRVRKHKKHSKYDALERPLEVKLSDELTSNLKNLKPEGNLFYDQMHLLQSSGKVEARVPVAKRRKYTPKVTEKWTYKDFK